jgi:hypothetical protein
MTLDPGNAVPLPHAAVRAGYATGDSQTSEGLFARNVVSYECGKDRSADSSGGVHAEK